MEELYFEHKQGGLLMIKVLFLMALLITINKALAQDSTHEQVTIKIMNGNCHDRYSRNGDIYYGRYRYINIKFADKSFAINAFHGDRIERDYECSISDFNDLKKYFGKNTTIEMQKEINTYPSRRDCEHNPGQRGQCSWTSAYKVTTYNFELEGIIWEYSEDSRYTNQQKLDTSKQEEFI